MRAYVAKSDLRSNVLGCLWMKGVRMKRMRMKGIEGKFIVTIVLVVVVILLAVGFVISQGGPAKWPFVWALFNEATGEYNKPTADKLDAAIKCSYFRCVSGCNADEIKDLEVEVGGKIKKCKEDLCDPIQKDGKVCGQENALQATVSNADGELLQKENIPFVSCIRDEQNCGDIKGPEGFVVIIKEGIKENTADESDFCRVPYPGHPGIKRVIILPATYKIWTSDYNLLAGGGYVTHVCT